MARLLLLIILPLLVLNSFGQNKSWFTVGAGLPIVLGTNGDDYSHYDYSIIGGDLFIEKDVAPLQKIPGLNFTPGFSYKSIKESIESSALGGGHESDYKHKAFSCYMKVLYEIDREPYVAVDYYFGVHSGFYIDSKTIGSSYSWQMCYDENDDLIQCSNSNKVNKSGEDFFGNTYFGLIAGCKLLGDEQSFFSPRVELAFYPSFATINSYYANNDDEKKNMIQISISCGLGNKKRSKE